jgi:hypothetical protein
MDIFLDIETIPTQNDKLIQEIRDSIKPPANYSKPETIKKWMEENLEAEFDKKYRLTALDGLHGEIISIAWAFDDEEPQGIYRDSIGEDELLARFYNSLSFVRDKRGNRAVINKWVGHYITGFDLRFIWQRSVIKCVRPSVNIPYNAKPWDNNVFDTKIAWTGASSYSGAGSLDALCKAFDLDGKGDIDGSKVYDNWLAGNHAEIFEYNKDDVRKCRELYKRMNFIYAPIEDFELDVA